MVEFNPSYNEFRKIIACIKESGKAMDYLQALNSDEFLIMRHDVEFSIDRAYKMSIIETEEDFTSTYFIQITNNSYNPFSKRNIEKIKDMAARGHHIGLHYHLNGQIDPVIVRDGVRDQMRIMSEFLNMPIDIYSFHRPKKEVYYYNIEIPYTINAYSRKFFSFAENINEDTELEVKYIADSKHQWNYGYPDIETLKKYKKIQLLIHPYSWSEEGYGNNLNFLYLIKEKQKELIETLEGESLRFKEVKNKYFLD